MNKSESIINLIKATIKVMAEVKGIDKTMVVGTGNSSYKGVSDQEVKKIVGNAMATNGLCIFPISVKAKTKIERWEEVDSYSKTGATKSKQSVFTEVETSYLLCHDSGEFIELAGYGQGVDSQDKGGGKSETYALKYLLLYSFLIPTGKIDDADNDHSDGKEVPPPVKTPLQEAIEKLPNCKDIADLTDLKNLVGKEIADSKEFKHHSMMRYNTILNQQPKP